MTITRLIVMPGARYWMFRSSLLKRGPATSLGNMDGRSTKWRAWRRFEGLRPSLSDLTQPPASSVTHRNRYCANDLAQPWRVETLLELGANVSRDPIMDADSYIAERLDDQIGWYDRKSLSNQHWYKGVRALQFVAAALIPFLTAYLPPDRSTTQLAVGLLGVTIAVATAALELCRCQEHWIQYRTTCESLKKEKILFLTESEPYSGDAAANSRLLVHRAETLISKENSNWAEHVRPTEQGDQ